MRYLKTYKQIMESINVGIYDDIIYSSDINKKRTFIKLNNYEINHSGFNEIYTDRKLDISITKVENYLENIIEYKTNNKINNIEEVYNKMELIYDTTQVFIRLLIFMGLKDVDLDRLSEFEVIKFGQIDQINLEMLFDFYEVKFVESEYLYLKSEIEKKMNDIINFNWSERVINSIFNTYRTKFLKESVNYTDKLIYSTTLLNKIDYYKNNKIITNDDDYFDCDTTLSKYIDESNNQVSMEYKYDTGYNLVKFYTENDYHNYIEDNRKDSSKRNKDISEYINKEAKDLYSKHDTMWISTKILIKVLNQFGLKGADINRLDEFEVIKSNEIDYLKLEQLFNFYNVEFDKNKFKYIIENIEKDIDKYSGEFFSNLHIGLLEVKYHQSLL